MNWCFQGIAYVLHLRIPNKPQKSQNTSETTKISEYLRNHKQSRNTTFKSTKYPTNNKNHRIHQKPWTSSEHYQKRQKILKYQTNEIQSKYIPTISKYTPNIKLSYPSNTSNSRTIDICTNWVLEWKFLKSFPEPADLKEETRLCTISQHVWLWELKHWKKRKRIYFKVSSYKMRRDL